MIQCMQCGKKVSVLYDGMCEDCRWDNYYEQIRAAMTYEQDLRALYLSDTKINYEDYLREEYQQELLRDFRGY